MLDHVEGEVVRSAKAPDCQSQEEGDFQGGLFQKDQCAGNEANQQEQKALGPQQLRVLDVGHGSLRFAD